MLSDDDIGRLVDRAECETDTWRALQAMHELCVWVWCNGLTELEQWGDAEAMAGYRIGKTLWE